MNWIKKIFLRLTHWRKILALPTKEDGSLDDDKISAIYVIVDENDKPIYIVALTSSGSIIEPATPQALGLIKTFKREIIYYSILDFVLHFHHTTAIEELKKKIRYSI